MNYADKYEYLKHLPLIRIENRDQYLVKQPGYHPTTKEYKAFQKDQISKCIYGMWGKESKGYRWLSNYGYFYANYIKIEQNTETGEQLMVKARLDDLEWMLTYAFVEGYGFSGFEDDEEFSCDTALIDPYEMDIARLYELKGSKRLQHMTKPNGELKMYVEPQKYLYGLHSKPMGFPLWYNQAQDLSIMGSRASGKSYVLVGLVLWLMIFDGTTEISKKWTSMQMSAHVVMGAAEEIATTEFSRRLEVAMNCLLNDEDLGVYKARNIPNEPLLGRHMIGRPHDHWEYRILDSAGTKSGGTGSSFRTVSYSPNKKGGGATSAASTRVHLSILDEFGKFLVSPIDILGSNTYLTKRGTKFGMQICAGTSGNLELVQDAKKIFENPGSFNMIKFPRLCSQNQIGYTGFFIPAFITNRLFKDNDGNTMIDKAVDFYVRELEKLDTPESITNHLMNMPLEIEDMWTKKENSFMPKEQAKKRYQQLMLLKNQGREESFRKFVDLTYNGDKIDVVYVNPKEAITLDSYYDSQGSNKNKKELDTHIIIYEEPDEDIKPDMYFYSLDPYVSDEKGEGSSLGSFYVYKSSRYIHDGRTGNMIVAEYTGKAESRTKFMLKIEMIIHLYGNCRRGFMFEANQGSDFITEFFKKRNKEHLLAFSPVKYDNKFKPTMSIKYGYLIGQGEPKLEMLNVFADWLMERTVLYTDGDKLNIERMCSLGLLHEIMNYSYELDKAKKANYDRIMSALGLMIAKRENYNQFVEQVIQSKETIYSAFAAKAKDAYKVPLLK